MKQTSAKNDPWAPQEATHGLIPPMPVDPFHHLVSSDQYLASLEKKLTKLNQNGFSEPTSRDIVSSLSRLRTDQMARFLQESQHRSLVDQSEVSAGSYIQRRLFPEKQAVTGEELVILVQDDVLAKTTSEQKDLGESDNKPAAVQPTETNNDSDNSVAMPTDTAEITNADGSLWVATFPEKET